MSATSTKPAHDTPLNVWLWATDETAKLLLPSLSEATVTHYPLLSIKLIPPPPSSGAIQPNHYDGIIFISANAVSLGLPWLNIKKGGALVKPKVYTMGEASARLLKPYFQTIITPKKGNDSEALLCAMDEQDETMGGVNPDIPLEHDFPLHQKTPRGKSEFNAIHEHTILIVKGEGGRGWLKDSLVARGAKVDEIIVYRREPNVAALQDLAKTNVNNARPQAIIANSTEVITAFTQFVDSGLMTKAHHDSILRIPIIVHHWKIRLSALQCGFTCVYAVQNMAELTPKKIISLLAGPPKENE